MSVVAAYIYRDGKRDRAIDVEALDDVVAGAGEFLWIGLFEPSEAELKTLQRRFNLHPLAVEDAFKAHQAPKIEVYGQELFVVGRTAQLIDGEIAYGETSIFIGPGHVITVRHGSARAHTDLRHQLEASPELLRHGVDYVLHAVLDFIVDGYLPIIEALEDEVLDIERLALAEEAAADFSRLAAHLSSDWSGERAFEAARTLVVDMLDLWLTHGAALRVEHLLADRGEPAFAESRVRRLRRLHLAVERRMAQAQAGGLLPEGLSPRLASYELVSLMESVAAGFTLLRRADTPDAIIDTTAHIVAKLTTGR